MTERLQNLERILHSLTEERGEQYPLPADLTGRQRLMRGLLNMREPWPATEAFLQAQDQELQTQREEKGTVSPDEIPTRQTVAHCQLKLWQGDITRLQTDAIVNAANEQLLGCFIPLHACIDNAIHSAAGLQLRQECYELMQRQGHAEPVGTAKVTQGYNLPARYVIHTVGPTVPNGIPTEAQEAQLASCYRSCLQAAEEKGLASIAFCCISTGVFHFPNQRAAEIAVQTVREFPCQSVSTIIFNVFKETDYAIYEQLL